MRVVALLACLAVAAACDPGSEGVVTGEHTEAGTGSTPGEPRAGELVLAVAEAVRVQRP